MIKINLELIYNNLEYITTDKYYQSRPLVSVLTNLVINWVHLQSLKANIINIIISNMEVRRNKIYELFKL